MPSKTKPHLIYFETSYRRPHNDLENQHVSNDHKSIHDAATASSAGFTEGAPIHGTVHWSQLTPLLLKVFGKEWFERGCISVVFCTVVSHLQPVKAFIEQQPSSGKDKTKQVKVWMEHLDGRLVFDGTASLCNNNWNHDPPPPLTMVDYQLQKIKPLKGNLVFCPYQPSTKSLNKEKVCIKWDEIIGDLFPFSTKEKMEYITEWHPWFSQDHYCNNSDSDSSPGTNSSPWKKPILSPEGLNQIMLYTMKTTKWPKPLYNISSSSPNNKKTTPIGLFGACEVKLFHGPIFLGKNYVLEREIIGVGETPKTEFRWTKTVMRENDDDGRVVAEMKLQDMMLKYTVEGYDDMRRIANSKSISRL